MRTTHDAPAHRRSPGGPPSGRTPSCTERLSPQTPVAFRVFHLPSVCSVYDYEQPSHRRKNALRRRELSVPPKEKQNEFFPSPNVPKKQKVFSFLPPLFIISHRFFLFSPPPTVFPLLFPFHLPSTPEGFPGQPFSPPSLPPSDAGRLPRTTLTRVRSP